RATVASSPATAGFAETQPARDVTATDPARAKQRLATDPTMQSDPTIDGPMAATLPGPHGVADLPTLQRIDDSAYAIGEELARGGMGKILFARDRRLRRDVVIKVMRRESGRVDPRFEREALITARLQHPSIVRVYDAGVFGDGRAFYAMERVRGRSLDVVIADAKTVRDRLALLPHAIAVCDAIAYAHSEGVLHRDLKPHNVLVGPFGETVVIDWGLAKDLRTSQAESASEERPADPDRGSSGDMLTVVGAVLGTPSYMAPEQARGEASDERTDIYALGALLYTSLSGEPPHRGRTADEVIELVSGGKRVPLGKREPGVPPELAAIVERAMAHEPQARFASALELAEELRRFAAGKLVASHTYSLGQLVRRWIRRYRVTLAVAAVALVILAVGGVLAVNNVMTERDFANTERLKAEAAEDRANTKYDSLLYGLAKKALSTDPSHAAAWLKLMSDRGLSWDKTQKVAIDAARLGLARELRGHAQDIEHVAVTPDGKYVITGSDDSTARIWNLANDALVAELKGHDGPIETMTLSSDGKYLATAGTDGDVRLWEIPSGTGRRLQGHHNTVRGVSFSPDNTKLASTGEDGTLFIWDVTSAASKELLKHTAGLRPVIWYDNTTVIVGGFDGKMGRYDVTTGKGSMVQAHDAELRCLALSPDRRYLISGDENGLVALWTGDGKRLRSLGRHTDVTRDVMFTPDGKFALSAGGDPIVRVYPIPDGKAYELTGHENGIKGLALDRDGKLVASAGLDNTVRVWTIDGKPFRVFLGTNDAVKAVAFTPDHRLVSGAENNIARIWRLDDIESPPPGPAMRQWLATHTNLEEETPDDTP
ncbi:MAG TPA: protein kinase, partial [Kofleriaceae bacterium]|nr:protein kinase [Kofleriaceae bacterium]